MITPCQCCGAEAETIDFRERYGVLHKMRVCRDCLSVNDLVFWKHYKKSEMKERTKTCPQGER